MEHEDQQVEEIKKFIKTYGPWIVAGVVIGLGSLFGWRAYSDHQVATQQARTAVYERALERLQAASPEEAPGIARNLLDEVSGTEHAGLIRLQLAQKLVLGNDLAAAKDELETALGEVKSSELQALIRTRIARIAIEQGDFDDAERHLSAINQSAYRGLVAEIRGDLLYARGNFSAARESYLLAQTEQAETASQALQMKIDNLAGQ